MNHVEVIEGFEVAIATLVEKVFICESFAGIYSGVQLSPQSAAALPELYAAVIVFAVKACAYFKDRGMYIISE